MRHNNCAGSCMSVEQNRHQHVLILGGLAQSLVTFRGPLIRELLAHSYRVTAMAGNADGEVERALKSWGAEFLTVPISRTGMNPLADFNTLRALVRTIADIKPDVFIGYTIKPSTYGVMAARLAGVRHRYAMITGLGYAFIEGNEFKRRLAKFIATLLYSIALKFSDVTIFQNSDDEEYFRQHILGRRSRIARTNGSGVDLDFYSPRPFPPGPFTFLMIARLLKDKGVFEFAEAARIVRRTNPDIRFVLVGPLDPSPNAISAAQVQAWIDEGAIAYRGPLDDIRAEIAACHVYVLPSYREGMPRTVLEAMAMRRPIITTDVPGCRETVDRDRGNGILVPPRKAGLLAEAALQMVSMGEQSLQKMAEASLELARERFDSKKVATETMRIVHLK